VPVPQASADLYTTLQRYQLLLLAAGRRVWSRMTPEFDAAWAQLAAQMTAYAAGAQLAAARAAVDYVPAVLAETGQPDRPGAAVRPQAFAGVASDGRSLPGLLEGSVVAAKRAVARGVDGGDALVYGQRWLETALQSVVSDAARDATQASIMVRPNLGYVRVVNPPCCSRCAVLAGRWYAWNASFDRHPRCDCGAIPATERRGGEFLTDPGALVRRGMVTDLSTDQRKRLNDGADLVKVLNESRDRWRVRMAADRRRERDARRRTQWAGGGTNPPPGSTIHDLMAHLTSRVDAIGAMRAAGIAQ
jgi:hypothetical protein